MRAHIGQPTYFNLLVHNKDHNRLCYKLSIAKQIDNGYKNQEYDDKLRLIYSQAEMDYLSDNGCF